MARFALFGVHLGLVLGHAQLERVGLEVHFVRVANQRGVEKVHARAADKTGHKNVGRGVIEHLRCVALLQDAIAQHGDAAAHRHGLDLVVGHVNERGLETLVQPAEHGASVNAELGVQVGQRLVHQEHRRVANDGASNGHALSLPARELLGLAVQQLADPQFVGCFLDPPVDLGLGGFAQPEAKGHVVVHGHVRVQSIALEHHGDVAVLGGDIVDQAVPDIDVALGQLFQAGQQTQARRLATARRSNKDQELFVRDVNVQVVDRHDIAEPLDDVLVLDVCH